MALPGTYLELEKEKRYVQADTCLSTCGLKVSSLWPLAEVPLENVYMNGTLLACPERWASAFSSSMSVCLICHQSDDNPSKMAALSSSCLIHGKSSWFSIALWCVKFSKKSLHPHQAGRREPFEMRGGEVLSLAHRWNRMGPLLTGLLYGRKFQRIFLFPVGFGVILILPQSSSQ